jgi:hypothetical protein
MTIFGFLALGADAVPAFRFSGLDIVVEIRTGRIKIGRWGLKRKLGTKCLAIRRKRAEVSRSKNDHRYRDDTKDEGW